jgi:putative ABC transport system substrate-binding protein
LLQATRSVPIVSPVFGDPVRFGFVDSLARPGGNVTGFVSFEYSMAAKWLAWALARTRRFRPKARTLRPRS